MAVAHIEFIDLNPPRPYKPPPPKNHLPSKTTSPPLNALDPRAIWTRAKFGPERNLDQRAFQEKMCRENCAEKSRNRKLLILNDFL